MVDAFITTLRRQSLRQKKVDLCKFQASHHEFWASQSYTVRLNIKEIETDIETGRDGARLHTGTFLNFKFCPT